MYQSASVMQKLQRHTHVECVWFQIVWIINGVYWNGQLVWTPALALYLCVGDCVQQDLSPTSGYTGISARRRYQFWERDLSPTFKRISDRICAASINLVNHKLIVISAYAPTLEVREANPELRELFYNQLDSTVSRDS